MTILVTPFCAAIKLPKEPPHATHKALLARVGNARNFRYFALPKNAAVVDPVVAVTAAPVTTMPPPVIETAGGSRGIGIIEFFHGKSFLITGSTGFVAKVLVEKILRSIPDVGKIFLLLKAKDNEEAMKRLKIEIIESELFKCLRQKHGKSYQDFMLSKLVPVVGNISESNLGMDSDSANKVAEEVDVIINSAANTSLDERYDVVLNANTIGPSRLMRFTKKCKKIKLFVHYSSAFANGERQGLILEKPFISGESITKERMEVESPSSPFPQLDIDTELELIENTKQTYQDNVVGQKLKELGLERARFFGWQGTYAFAKAMGEMLLNSMRGDVPLIILRPSIIESSISDPFPGWIQGHRVLDPLILSYGKGHLPGLHADPQVQMDVVPVDMVVNASMTAMAKHGMDGKSKIVVYHLTSAMVNPLVLDNLFNYSREYFLSSPFTNGEGKEIRVSEMRFFNTMDDFSAYISTKMARQFGNTADWKVSERVIMKKVQHMIKLAKIYKWNLFYKGWFHSGNTKKLMKAMSEEERVEFGFDFETIDWRSYIMKVHIPGLKKHVLKGRTVIG